MISLSTVEALKERRLNIQDIAAPEIDEKPPTILEQLLSKSDIEELVSQINLDIIESRTEEAVLDAGILVTLQPKLRSRLLVNEDHFFEVLDMYRTKMVTGEKAVKERAMKIVRFLAATKNLFPSQVDYVLVDDPALVVVATQKIIGESESIRLSSRDAWREAADMSVVTGELFDVSKMKDTTNVLIQEAERFHRDRWWEKEMQYMPFLSNVLAMRLFSPAEMARLSPTPEIWVQIQKTMEIQRSKYSVSFLLGDILRLAMLMADELQFDEAGIHLIFNEEPAAETQQSPPPQRRNF